MATVELNVPVDGKGLDWPRRVANAINALLRQARQASDGVDGLGARLDTAEGDITALQDAASVATGWGSYTDSGTQAIAANTRTLLTINAAAKDETQKPGDVPALWDGATNTLPGRNGDGGTWRLKFKATPTDTLASTLLIEADIGGAIGVLDEFERPLSKGAGIEHAITWVNSYFMRGTFAANGARFYVTSDGPVTIQSKTLLVQRTHKAR